jgi:isoleucyl-tRNA synthetase
LENLTNWYIRRSRRRFWKSDSDEDKASAYATLYTVLTQFCIIAAPFMPLITEYIWKVLTGDDVKNSVHLQDYPSVSLTIDTTLSDAMNYAQTIVRM